METVLITGGAGFIGSHLTKKLAKNKRIIIIDNFNNYYDPKLKEDRLRIFLKNIKFKLYSSDIRNLSNLKTIFKNHKIDKICHLAAMAGVRYSVEKPELYEDVNIKGTLNILNLTHQFKIKNIVFASSSSVYGNNKKIPFSENDTTDFPASPYGATKKANELFFQVYHHLYGLNCTLLRFFTVYGPWGRPDMACFKFTNNIFNNKPIDLYNYGKMERDFTYIDDIVSGIVSALEKNYSFEIINLGHNKPVTLKYFIEIIEKETGKKAKKNLIPHQPGDVLKTYANINKAKKMLNFKPKTTIEQGLKSFVKWYQEYY